jgi:hypothetical protein
MRKERPTPDLDSALQEWRQARPATASLSQPTRSRILRQRPAHIEPAVPLFFPARRLALATAIPLLVLSLMAGYLLMPGGALETAANGDGPVLQAVRQGDEVVFVIANGGGSHLVRKSNDPSILADSETFVVSDGAFRDSIDSGSNLVFYRIY